MTAPAVDTIPAPAGEEDHTFPTLTEQQIARVAAQGRTRTVEPGDVLVEAGDPVAHFYVVKSGAVEALQVRDNGDIRVRMLRPGLFSGEVSLLSGRRGLVTLRVAEAGEVIEVDREKLLYLVQTDAELSEIFVRAFMLRRVALVTQ